MKKSILAFAALVGMVFVTACDNDHDSNDHIGSQTAPNIEARALELGFEDVESYEAYVNEQCLLGCHENCDFYPDGKHEPCGYPDHSGMKHDGKKHNGTDHGQHDGKGNHHHNGNHH